jgi:tetratricopeptide (TPR) repeat protein
MNLRPETSNRQAFELVRLAQKYIDQYKQSGDRPRLESAHDSLKLALLEDPNYLRARYYKGIVSDLLGDAEEALTDLQAVREAKPPFIVEVNYHLGIANYHHYHRPYLEKAAKNFNDVLEQTRKGPRAIRLLARAALAQTYAMQMAPTFPHNADYEQCEAYLRSQDVRNQVKEYFDHSKDESDAVINALRVEKGIGKALNEIRWIVYNTRAISLMFYTDFFEQDRVTNLNHALKALEEADHNSPKNWSVYCNFGSTHMRLGHWLQPKAGPGGTANSPSSPQAAEHFEKALAYLNEVVEQLRPSYGFALYEKGRVYRLRGEFTKALDLFQQTETRPDRDVGNQRLALEKERARRNLTVYP